MFKISQSENDRKFIKKCGDGEIEVIADILDAGQDLPFIGSWFKLGKMAINYMDYRFAQKLNIFLMQSEKVDSKKRDEFISSLSKDDSKRISSYLMHLLYTAEEDEKANIMGIIYKARLLGEIDNEMMLRLCSSVSKCFVSDLKLLPNFLANSSEESNEDPIDDSIDESLAESNFVNSGLIDNFSGGYWTNGPFNALNEVGEALCHILKENHWFDS